MIKEAIDRIIGLAQVTTFTVDGRDYGDKEAKPIMAPLPERFAVTSLTSVVDLVKALQPVKQEEVVIHVASHAGIAVVARLNDSWGRRVHLLGATPPQSAEFKFGQWYDQETFIIALQSLFAIGGDLDYVLNLANNITTGKVTTSEDDGVTQRVTVKKGAALKQVLDMKRRVSLAPYRTFREIEQPFSDFVFRVKQVEDEVPALALFEADGGKWKLAAAKSVRDWLGEKLTGYLIVA